MNHAATWEMAGTAADAGDVRGISGNIARDLYEVGPITRRKNAGWYWDDCSVQRREYVIGQSLDTMVIRENIERKH